MAIRGKIGTKITINPIYMTNRRCSGSFGKIEDLVANPGDLTNFAPYPCFLSLRPAYMCLKIETVHCTLYSFNQRDINFRLLRKA